MEKTPKALSILSIAGIKDDLNSVTWPTRQQAIRLTLIVFVISLIVGAYVGIIDILMGKILEFFISHS